MNRFLDRMNFSATRPQFRAWAVVASALVVAAGALPGCTRHPQRTSDSQLQTSVAPDIPVVTESQTSSQENTPMSDPKKLTDLEWKERLSPEQYYVLRLKGTERPFTNEFDEHFESGSYSCAACGTELFESDTKFNSGCGWPAFYAAKAGEKVKLHKDLTHGMVRTEVTCAHCDSHLGHVFDDAPQTPTGQRFCINSVSLKFTPKE